MVLFHNGIFSKGNPTPPPTPSTSKWWIQLLSFGLAQVVILYTMILSLKICSDHMESLLSNTTKQKFHAFKKIKNKYKLEH